jgi:hypothetical protein
MKPNSQSINIISGFDFPVDTPDLVAHLMLFLKAPELQKKDSQYTGEGRIEHARIIARILWPKAFQWSSVE